MAGTMPDWSDDEVIRAITELVATGCYLDQIPGKPGFALAGGGSFTLAPGGARRRMYSRCSDEYREAAQLGAVDRLPPLSPASTRAVAEAEELLAQRLPGLLRTLYLEVGNGGFGPGYGLLGVAGGHADDTKRTAVDYYRDEFWPFLQRGLLPICNWGCAIYSYIDVTQPDGPIWGWDPNPGPTDETALFPSGRNLAQWLSEWVSCELHQPTLVQDPDGSWRGATDAEVAAWLAEDGIA